MYTKKLLFLYKKLLWLLISYQFAHASTFILSSEMVELKLHQLCFPDSHAGWLTVTSHQKEGLWEQPQKVREGNKEHPFSPGPHHGSCYSNDTCPSLQLVFSSPNQLLCVAYLHCFLFIPGSSWGYYSRLPGFLFALSALCCVVISQIKSILFSMTNVVFIFPSGFQLML